MHFIVVICFLFINTCLFVFSTQSTTHSKSSIFSRRHRRRYHCHYVHKEIENRHFPSYRNASAKRNENLKCIKSASLHHFILHSFSGIRPLYERDAC